ncbi:uncharacterized protein LOC134244705 [Saccostrea cucullata]|uniref:uncharacterized protein LOC134244705 n=1 Tax=Saccostrea cuccullata TaxID=36930 RepID=UPI002ED60A0F
MSKDTEQKKIPASPAKESAQDEDTKHLTTFNTPFGRYRYLRLPLGLKSSQDEFQTKIDECYEGLNGVVALVDDILVFGQTKEEHDRNLRSYKVKRGVKLNKDKLEVGVTKVKNFDHLLTSEGVGPDPDKVSAVRDMKPPRDKSELETFLGMVTYSAKFAPNLSEITSPLKMLLAKDVIFHWDSSQVEAFDKVKDLITNSPSPRFHQYIYGRKVKVQRDHKPLIAIFKKALFAAPPRLQQKLLQLQNYYLEMDYVPGKQIPVVDSLSRNFVDETFQSFLKTWKPIDCPYQSIELWNHRDELTITDGILLKGTTVLIPHSLRAKILECIHIGHMGIEKSLRIEGTHISILAEISSDIKDLVSHCDVHLKNRCSNPKQPLQPHPVPDYPWKIVATDLFFWDNKDFLIVTDY